MSITPSDALALFFIGTVGASFGSFIGLGGGVIFIPALFIVFPHLSPTNISAISLATVFFNSTTGATQYSLRKLTNFKYTFIISAMAVPTAILSPFYKPFFQKDFFYNAFVSLLILASISIFFRAVKQKEEINKKPPNFFFFIPISLLVGGVSSVFGVGGGVILMPAFLLLRPFSTHHAVGTTQMIIALVSIGGLISHIYQKNLILNYALFLCIGAIIGANIGVWLATKSKSSTIKYIISLALIVIAISLFIKYNF